MQVQFRPPPRIFEGTPLEVVIEGVTPPNGENLRMTVSSLGKVPLQCRDDRCHGQFSIPTKGQYQLSIVGEESWNRTLIVEQVERISLMRELGIFIPSLFVILTGIIVWASKRRKKKT